MLFFSSIHENWDCFDPAVRDERVQTVSALLEAIALNHPRNTVDCFDRLEELGIILGNGGFGTMLIQRDPFGSITTTDDSWAKAVISRARDCIHAPIWYCFSVSSRLYILVCYPRLTETDPRVGEVEEGLWVAWTKLYEALSPQAPKLRMMAGDMQFGDNGIFRSFNNLHHAMEYYDFLDLAPPLIRLNSLEQLHGAFVRDLSVYRQFSVSIAEKLSRPQSQPEVLAKEICDRILESSVPSIESVHHHIQIFMLTFTDYLGSSGLVDSAYMTRHEIVYRALEFEREHEFRRNMNGLITELCQQNQTLRAIGKQQRTNNIREYVLKNINNPNLNVNAISQQFGISTTQLSKQFKYYYGISLYRFLQQNRFQLAQTLLKEHPDWSVQKVAEESGYSDLSTMYRAFRQFGDVTPAALRDALQQNKTDLPT